VLPNVETRTMNLHTSALIKKHPALLSRLLVPNAPCSRRAFRMSSKRSDFHFDTHHFVQRLEREGLNRAQAEGIMSAMAEVIDESIRNMTSTMVTKAEQEKVDKRDPLPPFPPFPPFRALYSCLHSASLYSTGRLCADQV
jgi:Protein of unknown function (DUF1640)